MYVQLFLHVNDIIVEMSPTCEVKTGKAKVLNTITNQQISSLEECERECDDNCIAWSFFLWSNNKPYCSVWLFEGKFFKTFILNHDLI